MVSKWIGYYCRALSVLLVVLLALMVVLVFGNVVLRYAFNSGITVSEELSRWFFVWLTFTGAVIALHERHHMGFELLAFSLPPAGQRAIRVVGLGLMLWVTWLLFQGSLAQAKINWDVTAPVTGFSMAWIYGAGVFFALSTAPILLLDLWDVLHGRLPVRTDDYSVHGGE